MVGPLGNPWWGTWWPCPWELAQAETTCLNLWKTDGTAARPSHSHACYLEESRAWWVWKHICLFFVFFFFLILLLFKIVCAFFLVKYCCLYTIFQHLPCICCISRAPCSMGLGAMMVVWDAWHRLTILGGGAVWGGTGMALGNKWKRQKWTWSLF